MRSLPVRLGRGRSPLPHAAKPYPRVAGSPHRQFERKSNRISERNHLFANKRQSLLRKRKNMHKHHHIMRIRFSVSQNQSHTFAIAKPEGYKMSQQMFFNNESQHFIVQLLDSWKRMRNLIILFTVFTLGLSFFARCIINSLAHNDQMIEYSPESGKFIFRGGNEARDFVIIPSLPLTETGFQIKDGEELEISADGAVATDFNTGIDDHMLISTIDSVFHNSNTQTLHLKYLQRIGQNAGRFRNADGQLLGKSIEESKETFSDIFNRGPLVKNVAYGTLVGVFANNNLMNSAKSVDSLFAGSRTYSSFFAIGKHAIIRRNNGRITCFSDSKGISSFYVSGNPTLYLLANDAPTDYLVDFYDNKIKDTNWYKLSNSKKSSTTTAPLADSLRALLSARRISEMESTDTFERIGKRLEYFAASRNGIRYARWFADNRGQFFVRVSNRNHWKWGL